MSDKISESANTQEHAMNGQRAKRKAPHTAWKPGQCGNPSGRPKGHAAFALMARQYGANGLRILQEIAEDHSIKPAARVAAVQALFDRGYGKAAMRIDIGDAAETMTEAELLRIAAREFDEEAEALEAAGDQQKAYDKEDIATAEDLQLRVQPPDPPTPEPSQLFFRAPGDGSAEKE